MYVMHFIYVMHIVPAKYTYMYGGCKCFSHVPESRLKGGCGILAICPVLSWKHLRFCSDQAGTEISYKAKEMYTIGEWICVRHSRSVGFTLLLYCHTIFVQRPLKINALPLEIFCANMGMCVVLRLSQSAAFINVTLGLLYNANH